MFPVLIDLGFFKIYTFGVFLVLAFFWGTFLLWRNIRLTSFKEEDVFDGLFISMASGFIVGRLLYVIFNFNQFGFDILKYILINGYPGLSLFGSVVGAALGLYIFFLIKKIKFFDIVDYFITPGLLALGLGKIGSFFSGVEVGTKTKFFLAIKYAGFDGFRHLTALYEGFLFIIGAYLSYKLLFGIRRQKYAKGFNFYFFWWYLGLVYFLFDPLKSAHLTFITTDSLNKTFSLAILLTFTFYFLYYFRSSILGKIQIIKNSIYFYGQKTISRVYKTTGKKIKGDKDKNTSKD
ncbi:MAG: prolipoprotein diacylglyceryl transferase [Candidatus Roizmanbacteria bacterium]|nr:MAG: prolipoprotein diacylglyceryl transferase [Candidatus Roizmanbacteria bacterium]